MNWVGGARNRLRFSNERKIQREFFERNRFNAKLASRRNLTHPGRKYSQDLKALQTVSSMHSDAFTFQQPSRPVKMLDLDKFRSKSTIIAESLDLGPSSPVKTPSKLQLMEANQHRKQVSNKSDLSSSDENIFHLTPIPKYSSTQNLQGPSQNSKCQLYRVDEFKIPDIPRSKVVPNEVDLIGQKRKIWHRNRSDEMFSRSNFSSKKHKTAYPCFDKNSLFERQHDLANDLREQRITRTEAKQSENKCIRVPSIPFVSKATSTHPSVRNMFIEEDFQMTPIRKYHVEEDVIPNIGLGQFCGGVELTDLSDAEMERKDCYSSRPLVFQGQDFIQTPLQKELESTHQWDKAVDDITGNPSRLKIGSSPGNIYLKDFPPLSQLHFMGYPKELEQSMDDKVNLDSRLNDSRKLLSFATLDGIKMSAKEERCTISQTSTLSEDEASIPDSLYTQDIPKESANLCNTENHEQHNAERKHFTQRGIDKRMTEVLEELQELERQDQMDDWSLDDLETSQHQEVPCSIQFDEEKDEEASFEDYMDEEVKRAMDDMVSRVVAECREDFEFDHYDVQMASQCSSTVDQVPENRTDRNNTLREETQVHFVDIELQHLDKRFENKQEFEVSASANGHDVKFRNASTSTNITETCDKETQYSPIVGGAYWLQTEFSLDNLQCNLPEKIDNRIVPIGITIAREAVPAYSLRSKAKM